MTIIDALDKCVDNDPESAFLCPLSEYVHRMPSVKSFVTGRPEERIDDGVHLPSLRSHRDGYQAFSRNRFKHSRSGYWGNHLTIACHIRQESWGKEMGHSAMAGLERMTSVISLHCSAALFIYADTTFKYNDFCREDPRKLLGCTVSLPDRSTN
jgi:hypothetical protein